MKKMKISKKQLAAAAFAAFFLIMAVCTGISRIAASILVPKVTTESVQEGKLSVVIQGKGIVETRMESLHLAGEGAAGRKGTFCGDSGKERRCSFTV